jgi:hypothetical protein
MLLTMTITESETARWASDPALRAWLKDSARFYARRTNRRFFQIRAADGRLLCVGGL